MTTPYPRSPHPGAENSDPDSCLADKQAPGVFCLFIVKMAVVGHYECGFLVDHKESISESVSPLSLSCKEALFALYEPYFRSSADSSSGSKRRKVGFYVIMYEKSAGKVF